MQIGTSGGEVFAWHKFRSPTDPEGHIQSLPPPFLQTQGTSSPALFYTCALLSFRPGACTGAQLSTEDWSLTACRARGDVQAGRQLSGRQFSPCTMWNPGTGLGLSDLVVSTSELLFGKPPPSLPSRSLLKGQPRGESRSLPTPAPMQSSFPSRVPLSWLSPATS